MIEIPLGRGYVAIVDDEDAPLAAFRWYARREIHTTYAQRHASQADGSSVTVQLHRVVIGAGPGERVDHRDGDGLNCRRENLRLASPTENARNSRQRRNSSGFRGVYWHKRTGTWAAAIRGPGGKRRYLGHFHDPAEAAASYAAASLLLHGDFARTDSPTARADE